MVTNKKSSDIKFLPVSGNFFLSQEMLLQAIDWSEQERTQSSKVMPNYLKSSGLSKEVYSADVRAVVENARCVLDLASLALKLKEFGSSHIKVAAVEFPKFKEAIQKVPIVSLQFVQIDEIKIFLESLVNKL